MARITYAAGINHQQESTMQQCRLTSCFMRLYGQEGGGVKYCQTTWSSITQDPLKMKTCRLVVASKPEVVNLSVDIAGYSFMSARIVPS